MQRDPYAVLGIPQTASDQEIKQAFRQLARECHPDVAGDDPETAQRFKAVRAAYELLSDPTLRARYDRRHDRPTGPNSAFETFWRASMRHETQRPPRRRGASGLHDPANHVSLDDLMNFDTVTVKRPEPHTAKRPPPPKPPPQPEPPPPSPVTDMVDVPLVIALQGGTVTARTPGGDVRLTIPAGTDGGTRFRLAGKGRQGNDWVVRTRIVLPSDLDDEARALLAALAGRLTS